MKMTISVCMTTYNGEKYIKEQLESIRNQTRQPDEVIICDDCSNDHTVQLLREYIAVNGLTDKWRVFYNKQNRGYPRNFYYAMSLCRGNIVFLADQDDIWEPHKIEAMSREMEANEEIWLLASAWRVIDGRGKMAGKKRLSSSEQSLVNPIPISFSQIFYSFRWPGMSMCYRNEFGRKVLDKVQHMKLAHDVALVIAASQTDSFYSMGECLQYHRNHEDNVAMEEHRGIKLLNKKRKILEIKIYNRMLNEILNCPTLLQQDNRELVVRKQAIMQERLENLRQGKLLPIIRQYLQNRDMIRTATVACDCIICWQKSKDIVK